jgi:hypothetical protein
MNALGSPDLKLAGFQVWVHGYEFPDAEDAWDGNWLRATAHCGASGASVEVRGAFLDTVAVARFRAGMAAMYGTLDGAAALGTDEPTLDVRLTATVHGHIHMHVEITPDHLHQAHSFDFEIDQSYLPRAITQCDALLQRYPVRDPSSRGV